MVRMVFVEMQPFKGVENYFTDSLLYRENGKVVKKSLRDDINSGNEADSESGEDLEVSFDEEPIVAFLNDPDCNNFTDNGDEWVLNENVNFKYSLCCDNVNSPVDMSSLHIPLPISTTCMHIEEIDGSILVPSSKKDQSMIIFGKTRYWITTSNDSDEDEEPPQFFHYARSAHCMMKEIGYDLRRGECVNFEKGRCIPLQPFVPKRKSANYYD